MPDSYILSYGGTQVDVASFTQADPGADFGQRDLLSAAYVEGPHTDGALAVEEAGVRRMSFPLILAASRSIPNLGLEDTEALLRRLARPGATLDVRPQGATSYTRFDVLGGRYDFSYSVHQNRAGLRLGSLRVETKSYGYWPTSILLASAASIGLPGTLSWAGTIIGDAPGLAKIVVQPTVATNIAAGSWVPDFLALALNHRASQLAHLQAASLGLFAGASLLNDGFAPASQAVRYAASQNQGTWTIITAFQLASALEPAHRGRFRAFGWFRVEPSQALPWYTTIDAVPQANASAAMASFMPVATIPPAVATGAPGIYGAQPSPAYLLQELGEITLPVTGSGMGGDQRIRLWMTPATTNVGVASPVLVVGGLHLLAADSDAAGLLPRGLAYPSVLTPSAGKLTVDARSGAAVISSTDLDLATANPVVNAWQHYRGQLPRVASAVRLDLIGGSRKTASGATAPVVHNAPAFAAVSVSYTPRFQFIKGL